MSKFRTVDLDQGSEEWLEWRSRHWNASEASVIMGVAPTWYEANTWDKLRLAKAGLNDVSAQAQAMFDHGHRRETEARKWLEEQVWRGFSPAVIEQVANPKIGASLDGLHVDKDGYVTWCEIKCPTNRAKWHHGVTSWANIPEYHRWQLLHQFWALGEERATCLFVIYPPDQDNAVVILTVLTRERHGNEIGRLAEQWEAFDRGYDPGRTDIEWAVAAGEWKTAKTEIDKIKAQLGEAENELKLSAGKLIQLADSGDTEGCGVKVTEIKRKGSIDPDKVKAAGVDPDKCRKPDTVSIRVSATG